MTHSHYDVDINPVVRATNQKKPRTLLRAVWEQLALDQTKSDWQDAFGASAFDGRKNCFTPVKFPLADDELATLSTAIGHGGEIQLPSKRGDSSSDEESRRFKVSLKMVAQIDLEAVMAFCRADQQSPSGEEECLTGLMATNVLLRDVPSKIYTQVGATGNKFYSLQGSRPLPQGAIVCKGFMQSFRYSNSGLPLLNLDLGFSAFLCSGPAIDAISKILGAGASGMRGGRGDINVLDERQIHLLKRKLRGAKFTVTHRNSHRLHTVISVTQRSAQEITFDREGRDGGPGSRITVAEYYKEYYGVPVTKPRLPCIQYGKRAYVPLEFVRFAEFNSLPPTNQTAEQTAEMIKVSAMKPSLRADAINKWRKELAYESQSKIAAWGLQVNSKMVQLQARVLPPPKVQYDGREASVNGGKWNIRGHRYFRKSLRPLTNWAIISYDKFCDVDTMKRYAWYLCDILVAHGLDVANTSPACIGPMDPRQNQNIKMGLMQAAKESFLVSRQNPQLICVILPGRDAWLYESIKRISFTELKLPVPTQCMQGAKIKMTRGIEAYTGNISMKILSKMGGLSHQIPLSELPGMEYGKTMILGADLGHPPFRPNSDVPTVACSIATFNADCNAYSAQIRLQEGRSEIIAELSSMVEAHLLAFAHHNNGEYPQRILIFRDGISEGQYAACLQYEHDAVVRACARLNANYRPRILVCVCAKRHSTRFFSKDGTDVDSSGNLPPGLIVDRSVTHPYAFDFFLQAHAGLIGTARPTHYVCLLDELAVTPDQLQQLVHGLCYSFARCTRSVSVVPVCYMADLVCQKARIIVHDSESSIAPSETSGGRSVRRTESVAGRGSGRDNLFGRRAVDKIDVMRIQKLLARSSELNEVGWWM